jgi:phage gpG-like protein
VFFGFQFNLRWEYRPVGGGVKRGHEIIFHDLFTKFRQEVGNYAPAFHLIAEDILEPVVAQTFKQERAELTWQDLAPSTVAHRGSEHPILHHSGMLEESFRKGQPAHHEEITPRRLVWGSDVPYALFHQTGTGKGFGRDRMATGPGTGHGMPRRKEIFLSDRMKHQIHNIMSGRMDQVARQYGFGVTRDRGLSPLEARMIGQKILGGWQ